MFKTPPSPRTYLAQHGQIPFYSLSYLIGLLLTDFSIFSLSYLVKSVSYPSCNDTTKLILSLSKKASKLLEELCNGVIASLLLVWIKDAGLKMVIEAFMLKTKCSTCDKILPNDIFIIMFNNGHLPLGNQKSQF